MELSVVVPTLNGRDELVACLDALTEHVDPAELIVVNGPSADGTTGTVRARDDVEVLVELADRNVNAARNAGIEVATGDAIAFVDERTVVGEDWIDAVDRGLANGAAAVTGPIRRRMRVGVETSTPEARRIGSREVTYFDGGNVAFLQRALGRLDGFDEYLPVGGARDAAHRLAAHDLRVAWDPVAAAQRGDEDANRGDPAWKYRSIAYRLAKNYGLGPAAVGRTFRHTVGDRFGVLREVFAGTLPPSAWLGQGRDAVVGSLRGVIDGTIARHRDPVRHNPNGVSSRADRAVRRYDWR